MYVGQHAVGMTAKETNCYSLYVEVCSDSRHSETRLPGLLKVILCRVCCCDEVVFPVLPGAPATGSFVWGLWVLGRLNVFT